MQAITTNLLADSGITPESYPLMVSLLEFGAQRLPVAGGKGGAALARAYRQWREVAKAFQRCRDLGVSDSDLRTAMPFQGLSLSQKGGWEASGAQKDQCRVLVANALLSAAESKAGGLKPLPLETLADLRKAQAWNRIRELDAAPVDRGKVETPLLSGRRLVVSFPIHGRKVFSVLQADSCGRVRAISVEKTKRAAIAAASKGAKSR